MLRLSLFLVALAACTPPASPHIGAATPTPLDEHPDAAEARRFPKGDLRARYQLFQRDRCGSRCSYARDGSARLQLDLREDGSVIAMDDGALRETFQSTGGSTEQRIEWKRAWQGRWKGDEGTVHVALLPHQLVCRRVDQHGSVDTPCKPLSLELECSAINVELDEKPPGVEKSWVCEPTGAASAEGITPFPWVFGMHRDLVAREAGTTQEPKRRYKLVPPPKKD